MPRRKIPALMPPGLVDSTGAAEILGVSAATFFRYRKEPDFPVPVQPGNRGRATLYREDDVRAWRQQREAAASKKGEK